MHFDMSKMSKKNLEEYLNYELSFNSNNLSHILVQELPKNML